MDEQISDKSDKMDQDLPMPEESDASDYEEENFDLSELPEDDSNMDMDIDMSMDPALDFDLSPERELEFTERRRRPERTIPLNAAIFAVRFLVAIVLLALSASLSLPDSGVLGMRVAAFLLCALGVIITFVCEVVGKRSFLRSLLFLVIASAAAGTGRFASASVSILLMEVGSGLLDYLCSKKLRTAERRLEVLRDRGQGAPAACVDAVMDGIRNRRLPKLAAFLTYNRYFLWAAAGLAAILGLIVPLFDGFSFSKWLYRAATVLTAASCCVLWELLACSVLETTGRLFAKGVCYRTPEVLHSLSAVTSVVFNKTGVITDGVFRVVGVEPVRISEDELLYLASYAEVYSDHPLAEAIRERAGVSVDKSRISKHTENRGIGNVVQLDDQIVSIGSIELMEKLGVAGEYGTLDLTSAFVAVGRTYVGRIDFEDTVRPSACDAVRALRGADVTNIALMTGDNAMLATRIGREVGITEVYSDCLLRDKVSRIQYIRKTRAKDDRLAIITDDPEESPVLAAGEVGILLNPDAAAEDLDREGVALLACSDNPALAAEAVGTSKHVTRRFRRLWIASLAADGVLAAAAAFGLLELWGAVLLELGIQAVIAVLGFEGGALYQLFRSEKK